jgi:hypothetical protein
VVRIETFSRILFRRSVALGKSVQCRGCLPHKTPREALEQEFLRPRNHDSNPSTSRSSCHSLLYTAGTMT